GNPPYLRVQTMQKDDVDYFSTAYQVATKNYDIYTLFIEQGLALITMLGRQGYIVPHKFFEAKYGEPLRKLLSDGRHLSSIIHFGDLQIFDGATTYVCVLINSKAPQHDFRFTKVDNIEGWKNR